MHESEVKNQLIKKGETKKKVVTLKDKERKYQKMAGYRSLEVSPHETIAQAIRNKNAKHRYGDMTNDEEERKEFSPSEGGAETDENPPVNKQLEQLKVKMATFVQNYSACLKKLVVANDHMKKDLEKKS